VAGNGIPDRIIQYVSVTPLQKVEAELARYDHALLLFSAHEKPDGTVELIIRTRQDIPGVHTYYAPMHPRDIAHPQFPWTFQKYLYDCLHDYLVELFLHTPQSREGQ
jgi:hypothetical protein